MEKREPAKRELTCIGCPLGCAVTVCLSGGRVESITGNTCKIGESYARKEVTAPERIVTSTVAVLGGKLPVVSVKTRENIPKGRIFDIMKVLRSVRVDAPVRLGDVLVPDICGTGVDIVATKSVEAAEA